MSFDTLSDDGGGQALPVGTRLEGYVVERVLGVGGFGMTYLARDENLGRQVVIKENLPVAYCYRDTGSLSVYPRSKGGEDEASFRWSLENFAKEGAMLARLDHPGIVKGLRSFSAFGTRYFVMPYVEGETLDRKIERRKESGEGFAEDEVLGLLEWVLEALEYLHGEGIYHRDIKPANILITVEGKPVLIDFGAARQRLGERSMTVVESMGYTAFEQLESRGNVGPWTDLYALGGTVVKMIAGEALPKAMDRVKRDPYVKLGSREEMRVRYGKDVLWGIDRAVEVDEKERWQNAGEWMEWMRGGGGAAGGVGVGVRGKLVEMVRRLGKNGGVKFGVAVVGVGVVVMLLGLVMWGMFGAEKERRRERRRADVAEAKANQVAKDNRVLVEQAKLAGERKAKAEAKAAEGRVVLAPAPVGFVAVTGLGSGGFYMGKDEMTWGEWKEVREWAVGNGYEMEAGLGKGEKYPVTNVSWYEAVKWCNARSEKEGLVPVYVVGGAVYRGGNSLPTVNVGNGYRLPTEAEWEYAARGGVKTHGYEYSGSADVNVVAWYKENSGSRTHEVGKKAGNELGIHDMSGNVWEWCFDAGTGTKRVSRGGSWDNYASYARVSFSYGDDPAGGDDFGFRVVRSAVP